MNTTDLNIDPKQHICPCSYSLIHLKTIEGSRSHGRQVNELLNHYGQSDILQANEVTTIDLQLSNELKCRLP
jgi:hypothetical protein